MKFDDIRKLHKRKYREQSGHYLIEGEHLILELQKAASQSKISTPEQIQLFVTEKYQNWDSIFKKSVVSAKQMSRLSDTKSPQGIIACVPMPTTCETMPTEETSLFHNDSTQAQLERCIYLYEVQDPGNLGTILRTLGWFGHFRLLLSPNSVDPYNSKAIRASMGATFHVTVEREVELTTLNKRFDRLAYLDITGQTIKSASFADYECYLFGNEARGVPKAELEKLNAAAFTIPGNGDLESLNLASAVTISAFQLLP